MIGFGIFLGIATLCIYIYLVTLAARFVSAFEQIAAAAQRAVDKYGHGPA